MKNPYDVLGIPENASEEDIKKAYRALSRKYHPDANVNNPDKEKAEEKFKEIQQAYQQIMQMRERGESFQGSYGSGYGNGQSGSYGSYGDFGGFGGFGNFGGFGGFGQNTQNQQWSETDVRLGAAENYLRNRYFKEALHVLSEIQNRTAKWYYLSAQANYGMGNNVIAKEHAQKAVEMEPDNFLYRQLISQMENGSGWYNSMGGAYGSPVMASGDWCMKLCMINMLCNCCCCGRPMFFC